LLACPLFTSAHKALNTWDLLSWLIVVAFVREVHAAEAGWLRRFNIVAFALGHCLEGTRLLVYLVGAQELLVLLEDALVAAGLCPCRPWTGPGSWLGPSFAGNRFAASRPTAESSLSLGRRSASIKNLGTSTVATDHQHA
jgi:hypothetical protein